jgi:prepilin-type processing-associated H-X9-DG protein/prepilin-type N-terminal cleavage/methylation domain-containing protein
MSSGVSAPAQQKSLARDLPVGTPRRPAAFTLIELMVVTSIIALLASLSLAGLNRAKNAASSVKCINNLRQLGIALQLYVDDYGAYPSRESNFEAGRSVDWVEVLDPYISVDRRNSPKTGVWNCPSVPSQSRSIDYGYNAQSYAGFGLAPEVSMSAGGITTTRHVREADVKVPSDMIALGDALCRAGPYVLQIGQLLQRATLTYNHTDLKILGPSEHRRTLRRHAGKINLLFCDGHVQALTLTNAFFEQTDQALVKWNRDHEPHQQEWRQAVQW